jgi:hypothetical protein
MFDRPYASYLLIGHRKLSLNQSRKIKLASEIQIGILGKYSGGKSVQNGIHDILPTSRPSTGWDNQLSTDLAINYTLRFERGILHKKNLDVLPYIEGKLGIPYTDMGAGFYLRTGKFNSYFSQLMISDKRGIEVYLFIDLSARMVAYNATLQGGMFNENPHVLTNINNIVGDLKSGFVLGLRKFSFEFGQHFITPEFRGGKSHKWGYVTLRFAI